MKEYRIVKETTTNTNESTYYIERRKKFLIWEWWSKQSRYHPLYGAMLIRLYSYEEAKLCLNRFTDQIVTEVVE